MNQLHETPINNFQKDCPVRASLDVIRGRWKPAILRELQFSGRRYSELQAAIPLVTAQALTLQLKQLEADGIIERGVRNATDSPATYVLTALGKNLSGVMDQLEQFGNSYLEFRRSRP